MKKNLILCVTVLLFSFLLLGKAYGVERLSDDERAQFSLSEDFKNIDGVLRDEILDKANATLNSMGIKVNGDEEKVFMVENNDGSPEKYFKVIYNGNSFISLTENGELLGCDTLDYSAPKQGIQVRTRSVISPVLDRMDEMITSKGYINTIKKNYYNGTIYYKYDKVLSRGVVNKYDNYVFIYDPNSDNIVTLFRNKEELEYKEPMVSMHVAQEAALDYAEKDKITYTLNDVETSLGAYKKSSGEVVLAYITILSDGTKIVLSPQDSSVVEVDYSKATIKGKSIAYKGFRFAEQSAQLAEDGLRRLGYVMLPKYITSGEIGDTIINSITTAGFRGLYIDCHGSTEVLSTDTNEITASYLQKRYPNLGLRFAFLDACSTGANNNWANTFHISSKAGAFIGWDRRVGVNEAYDFCGYFWNEANGKKPILKAVQAAEMRASTNARPVFIGNNTFYGNAN
ncbi:hypothetical protein [Peptostreptococcus anaerobius]|uniref:hypothetical protein n=1 Tax=Peptostreptococcus anaerobius TaxID=1261 RepID=UPI003D6ECBA7